MDERVTGLIEDYMNHYEVGFGEAINIMIEDLNEAKKLGNLDNL